MLSFHAQNWQHYVAKGYLSINSYTQMHILNIHRGMCSVELRLDIYLDQCPPSQKELTERETVLLGVSQQGIAQVQNF